MRSYFLQSPPLAFDKAVDFLQQHKGQETEFGIIVNLLSWQIIPFGKVPEFYRVVIQVEVQWEWEKQEIRQ